MFSGNIPSTKTRRSARSTRTVVFPLPGPATIINGSASGFKMQACWWGFGGFLENREIAEHTNGK
jgi:hypothetical protein